MDEDIQTQFFEALYASNNAKIRLLLKTKKIDVNKIVPKGNSTPLIFAVLHRDHELALLLLENGANRDKCDKFGMSPLYCALLAKDEQLLVMLLQHGANPNVATAFIPLIKAIEIYSATCVKHLLRAGANIEIRLSGISFHTPLQHAIAGTARSRIIAVLLSHGANMYANYYWRKEDIFSHVMTKCQKSVKRVFCHNAVIDLVLAFFTLCLPPYVLIWMLDFIEGMQNYPEKCKIALIQRLQQRVKV